MFISHEATDSREVAAREFAAQQATAKALESVRNYQALKSELAQLDKDEQAGDVVSIATAIMW